MTNLYYVPDVFIALSLETKIVVVDLGVPKNAKIFPNTSTTPLSRPIFEKST